MRKLLLSSSLLLALCSNVNAQEIKSVGYDEASSFERTLLARDRPPIENPKRVFTQPINKKESCKLPTSSDQLERTNFRAYWDGDCKNGYAYGLGRDIAISDTHHLEEIVIHNGAGSTYKDMPGVTYDFVNNIVTYWVRGEVYPEVHQFQEYINNSISGLNINYRAGKTNRDGSIFMADSSPFVPWRIYHEIDPRIVYKYSEHALAPFVDYSVATFAAEIIDPKDGKNGGVAIVMFGKDQVRHFKIEGIQKTPIVISENYVSYLQGKHKNILDEVGRVNVEGARKVEREYLYSACNEKHRIAKLDKEVSSKICNWRDQFKESYEKSLAKYNQEIEQMKLKAVAELRSKEAQRISDQQRDAQQRQLEAQKRQMEAQREASNRQQAHQELQGMVNSLGQFGQQMNESGRQMLQSVQQPAPQVMPFSSFGASRTNCVTVGMVTNCR